MVARIPRIVLFTGGTAARSINIALCRRPVELTRVVPAWDSGGSSKVLREAFRMLPIGDVRQALMTMAHGEGHSGDVVKICNARLSDQLGAQQIRAEFEFYTSGAHPLLQRMQADVRAAILHYLALFRSRIDADFDLRNGSIGNFILTGAWLAENSNINRAIAVFRQLCSIEGKVWPVSTENDVQLSVTLGNGKVLERQHLITRMEEADSRSGVAGIRLTGSNSVVAANPVVVQAVNQADLIVFGPGSFYTSILPHILVNGIADAIATNARARKVFVGNILECAETRGVSLSKQVETFAKTMQSKSTTASLCYVLANRQLFPFEKMVGAFPYLTDGALAELAADSEMVVSRGDLEDAWTRGQHDGEAVAEELTRLAEGLPAQAD